MKSYFKMSPGTVEAKRRLRPLHAVWRVSALITAISQLLGQPYLLAATTSDGPVTAPAATVATLGGPSFTPPPPPEVKVNKSVPVPTAPLPGLSFKFPANDQQIEATHVLEEPLIPIGGKTSKAENDALAHALLKYAKDRNDISGLQSFVSAFPKSPWAASVLTNLGIIYRRTGYYTRALEAWRKAWSLAKSATQYPQTAVADRAVADLCHLLSNLGRREELQPLLDEVKDRPMRGGSATELNYARANSALMKTKPGISFKCGPFALGRIQRMLHPDQPLSPLIIKAQSSPKGFSLGQVEDLSEKLGMGFKMLKRTGNAPLILPSVVHWKSGHYAAILKEKDGRYVVQDPTFGEELRLTKEAIEDESSGYFLASATNLPAGWTIVGDKEAAGVWGRGLDSGRDPKCTKPCERNSSCSVGMARSSILFLLACLRIQDTPIRYTAPVGPQVDFTVTYNQYEASQTGQFVTSNFGNNWIHPWQSYVKCPGVTDAAVTLVPMGGGSEVYTGYEGTTTTGSYTPQIQFQTTLYVRPSTTQANQLCYIRMWPDGTQEIFDSPADSMNYIYLTQVIDPQGNSLTLTYTNPTDSLLNNLNVCRLSAVTDSIGQTTTLSYGLADPLKITAITDPFNRTAKFGYTETSPNNYQLTSITDVVGITSSFTYTPGTDVINSMTTPYGTTTFSSWQDASGDMGLTITDPNGGQECALARYAEGLPVQPEAVPNVPYANLDPLNNLSDSELANANTYYWDKKAMMDAPGDITKAHIFHWLYDNEADQATGILYCEKDALESRVWYNYDRPATSQPYMVGTSDKPTGIARVMPDGSTQESTYVYNTQGMLAQSTDPIGRQTFYTYAAANGIDLTMIQAGTGNTPTAVLGQVTYGATPHRPASIIDASGQTTSFTYNAQGQIWQVTDAKSETTTFTYDGNNRLTNIAGPVEGATTTLTYDGYGRVYTVTDSAGYTVTYNYDALNRPTVVTYPDGTYEQYVYNILDVGWKKDRLNRWTTLTYDATRNLTTVEDPLGRTTRFGYCSCGALVSLIDAAGNVTGWARDVEKRPTAKIFADGTKHLFSYDTVGRLESETDAKGQVKRYSYNPDDTVQQVSYDHAQNPTASVSFSYDTTYKRVLTMADGTGTTTYTYNAYSNVQPPTLTTGAGRLGSESGPLASATVAYGYDELGRMTSRSINGATNNGTTIAYDSLGRVHGITNPLGASGSGFVYNYVGATNRLSSIQYPNGQSTSYSYFGNTGDLRLQEIENLTSGSAVLSKFDYTYDAVGNIQSWTQQAGANTPNAYAYQYDSADQLTSATLSNTSTQAVLHQYLYGYDSGANRTTAQIDSQINTATPNNLNQVTATHGGGPLRFSGTIAQPGTVTVGGQPAVMSGTTFTGTANVMPGTNQVVVTATSNGGAPISHTYQVTATGSAPQAFTYDPNGNTINDGINTYEWDAEDRMTAINYGGTQNRSEFTYDGLSRRVAIVEKTNGTVTSTKKFVFAGSDIAEERAANNTVTKRFYPQGVQISGTAYFYTRDHLGSIRELTNAADQVLIRYDYDPYGQVSSTRYLTLLSADFGFTGHYFHAPSGFNLAPYRTYAAANGRWLSRDPIEEEGGINLYEYVFNKPASDVDVLGLCDFGDTLNYIAKGLVGGLIMGTGGAQPIGEPQNAFARWIDDAIAIAGGPAPIPVTTLLPDSYWKNRWSPTQVTPGIRQISENKPSSRANETYAKTTFYDQFGREIGQEHCTDHGEPAVHPDPHHHTRNPITGQRSKALPGEFPIPAEDIIW